MDELKKLYLAKLNYFKMEEYCNCNILFLFVINWWCKHRFFWTMNIYKIVKIIFLRPDLKNSVMGVGFENRLPF